MSGIEAEPAHTPPTTAERHEGPDGQSRRRLAFWVALIGGLAVAAVAGFVLFRGPQAPTYERFSATGSMTAVRNWPSLTLLPDGRVLVAGGLDAELKPVASAELYDPRTRTFSPTGSMATARAARAALLPDGRVLLVGGREADGRSIASAEVYDPRTGTFSSTGSMAVARDWPGVALLPDGRVLVTGGYADSKLRDRLIASAELYDPRTGTFSPTGSMGTARAAQATLLADGRVLATGGSKVGGASAELYDPRTGTFAPTGSMAVARDSPGVARLADGRVLVAGGIDANGKAIASAELYDPRTGTFSATGNLATPREVPAALLPDGRVLVAGGVDAKGKRTVRAELYDPRTGAFSTTGSMTVARYWPSLALLSDGRVLVVGFVAEDVDESRWASAELFE